jgi:hypothetical protein
MIGTENIAYSFNNTIDTEGGDLKQIIKECQRNISRNSYHLFIFEGFHEEDVTGISL